MSANQQDSRLQESDQESEDNNMTMVQERIMLGEERARMSEMLDKQAKEDK